MDPTTDPYDPGSYGEAFADVYDDWYADVTPVAATVAFLAGHTTGLVVELGSGTGRLAGVLAETLAGAGRAVVGLDASPAMVEQSRRRHPDLPVVLADMAAPPVRAGTAGAVLIAFNTLFNLPTPARQQRCLDRVADVLAPGGTLVIEAFVPGSGAQRASSEVSVSRIGLGFVVLQVSRTDPGSRTVVGHHVELRDGEQVRLRPWRLCFGAPADIDAMAERAGLVLVERFGDWQRGAFGADSDSHVSLYRRAPGPRADLPDGPGPPR